VAIGEEHERSTQSESAVVGEGGSRWRGGGGTWGNYMEGVRKEEDRVESEGLPRSVDQL